MIIGVDLRSLEDGTQHRGIGRYATELLEEISKIDKENHYVFFTSSPKATPPTFSFSNNFKTTLKTGKGKGWRRRVKFVRTLHVTPEPLNVDRFNIDVFFHIDINQPIKCKRTPVVSVLFDIIPFIYKDIYQKLDMDKISLPALIFQLRHKRRWKIAEKTLLDYKKSAAVVSISEYSRHDLLKFVPGLDANKVIAIPLAAGRPPESDNLAAQRFKKLGVKEFLFYVGGADPRKGLVNLVKDMENVWAINPDVQLILAGKEVTNLEIPESRRLAQTVKKCSRPSNVHLLGFVTDGELAWLYKNAEAFVFPSIYEGFGLPILEAMQVGCPVIAYNNSSIPEVAGSAAILVKDGEPLSTHINKLLADKNLHKKLVDKGLKQASKFTWHATASRTLKVLLEAGGKKL